MEESMHWADQTARKIIEERKSKTYVVATGVTPSGTLHIGNFRELVTGEFVAQALRDMGKKVTYYHYWDDYDVFRKIPKNMPKQDVLKKHLRKPIIYVPDVIGKDKNYSEHNTKEVEKYLPIVGVRPTIIKQSEQYLKCVYAEEIKTALENVDKLKEIFNKHRKEDLTEDWLPISVYCEKCHLEAEKIEYSSGYVVSYECSCGNKDRIDFRKKGLVKLKWRVQWPAWWHNKKVDFESAGKDHFAAGGSMDTAKEIAEKIYNIEYPEGFGFGWINIKGGKQFSSSAGVIVTLKEVLDVYEPSMVRWLFAGSRPGTEFAISFDLDVLKLYEDFDKLERIYYKKEKVDPKEYVKQKRIYELSCVDKPSKKMPFQPSFRHLCNVVQIYENDFDKIKESYQLKDKEDIERLKIRSECASDWLEKYAIKDMKFKVQEKSEKVKGKDKEAVEKLVSYLKKGKIDEKLLYEEFYNISKGVGIETKDFFKVCYRILINKERGPRLAPFILTIGKGKVLKLLNQVI